MPSPIKPLQIIDPLTWAGKTPPQREWMVNGIIPKRSVTMLSGDGGLGKSLLTLQLLIAAATGTSWLGMETMPCRTFGLYCEDDTDEIWRRVDDVTRYAGQTYSELEDVTLLSRVGEDNLLMVTDKYGKRPEATPLYHQVFEYIRDSGAQLVVVDSLHDLFGGNENSRPDARFFIGLLRKIALEIDGAVVLNAHPSMSGLQSGDGTAGSTAWNNSVRSRLYMSRPKAERDDADPDARILTSKKANYGKSGFSLPMRWTSGVFVPDQPDPLIQRIENGAIKKLISERVGETWAKDVPLSAAYNSANYLPKALAKASKYKVGQIEAAMREMMEAGSIVTDQRLSRLPKGLRLKEQACA